VLDEAAAPTEHAPTSEADGDAMEEDARNVLPDAAAPPLPVAAPGGPGPAPEPTPATATESGGDDGDAVMAPAKDWRDIARKFEEVASAASKKADKECFALVPLDSEDAKDYVPRVLEKYSKSNSASKSNSLYKSLAVALLGSEQGRALEMKDKKKAIFDALEGVPAADFRDKSKFTEAVAPMPAPAPPRTTEPLPWESDVENLLREIKDLSPKAIVPKLLSAGLTTASWDASQKKMSASPLDNWPCVVDVIGENVGSGYYQDVIRSKTQLVAYFEGALEYAREGKSFRSQSQKKADDARAAAARGPAPAQNEAAVAKLTENAEADMAHWHALAEDSSRHRIYRGMKANGVVFEGEDEDEPFLLLGPSGKQPPRLTRGFYAGPLAPGVDYSHDMSEEKCTTAEQKAAWRKAKRVREILNGVPVTTPRRWHLQFGSSSTQSMRQSAPCGFSAAWTSYDRSSTHLNRCPSQAKPKEGKLAVPGIYEPEYQAWKDMGGTAVGSREERQDYSERGLYADAIRNAIDALRRDDPRRFSNLARQNLRYLLAASEPHLNALAEHAGVDKEDLVSEDSYGRLRFVSGSGPCRLPGVLYGLVRKLHIEHVNGTWIGKSATLELKVRGLEDWKFNTAEPDYAFVTETPWMRAFVDGYLDNGALCFSKDDAERELFQFYMDPISTTARREFLALTSDERSQEERNFLREHAMAGVVNPKTDEDRRRHAILHKRHDQLTFVPWASGQAGGGSWTAVSRVPERKKEIGRWYPAKVLRRRDDGTYDVEFADDGYVAKGVTAGDVRIGRSKDEWSVPDVGATGEACYRGTKLDLDHVGLGWRWEPVEPSEEYPDGLKWYRILGIRDLLDYDINQHLSGYEWAKNLDLLDYFANYYKNALCEVGGYGIAAKDWVLPWTPAKGWAYGSYS